MSAAHLEHLVCPHLPKDLRIDWTNDPWGGNITCNSLHRGLHHPVAILASASQHVLCWWRSDKLLEGFRTDALDKAI